MSFRICLAAAFLVAMGMATAHAGVIVSDDFEGYANQAAMDAVWVPSGTSGGSQLSTDQSVSPTHSAFNDVDTRRSTQVFGDAPVPTDANPLVWSFQYYDTQAGVSLARNYMQLWDNSGGLAQLVSLGVYNAVPGESVADHHTYYRARVAFGGGPGWILLKEPGVATRSVGWHELKAVFGTSTVDFYVDGTQGASGITYGSGYTFDTMQLGSGLSSAGGAAYYDDVLLQSVPEPASLALLGFACLGLAVARRRA